MRQYFELKSVFVLFAVMTLLNGCFSSSDTLPTDFPSDIPIIEGEIYSARRTIFEDGPGFVVDVLTTLSEEEVVEF